MISEEHSRFRENIPSYALGALEGDDLAALEAHLRTCESCRAELADYQAVSSGLLTALPPRMPSASLRKQLQARLPSAQKRVQPRFVWSFGQLALGGAFILLFLINVFSFVQVRELQRQQSTLVQQMRNNQVALAMLSYPSTVSLPIQEGTVAGSILLDRDRNVAVVVMWDLPELPQGQTYQAWLIEPNGQRISAGLFLPDANSHYTTKPIYSKQELSSFTGIGVTIEPAQGSEQPTGPRIFKVDF